MDDSNYYHVDPATTRGDTAGNRAGRYPHNFVKFPWFLKPLEWGDSMSRAITGKPAHRIGDSLLKVFDSVEAPVGCWGTVEEIGVLRHTLSLLGKGYDDNPYLSPIGRFLLNNLVKENLKTRAKTIAFYEANRAFIEANGHFKAPVIVTGLFRTGTTLLQRLMSEDPNTRSPYLFELQTTVPPLRADADPMQDPRIAKSAAAVAATFRFMPGFMEEVYKAHPSSPKEKEESLLFMQTHNGMQYPTMGLAAGRAYFRRMHRPEVADALLKYERNFFTMLDAYCPAKSHWTLKAPSYAPYFAKIFEHYPDARVIVTHRHPSKNLSSLCRLAETSVLPFDINGSFDKQRFGRVAQEEYCIFWSRPLEFRKANPQYESQIIDCMYPDLMRDPIGMVKSIYAKFDLEYSREFEDRMKLYLADNQQGKHGRHKYTNEEYGIDPHELYERNKAYFDHYGFKLEPGSAD